jgi:hypothetical protein
VTNSLSDIEALLDEADELARLAEVARAHCHFAKARELTNKSYRARGRAHALLRELVAKKPQETMA